MNVFEKIREKIEEKAFSVQIKQGIKEPSTFDAMMEKFSVLEIKEVINQVEQEHNNGWIARSERLPEEDGFYLATLDGEIAGEEKPFSGLAEFENGKWVDDDEDYQCIIAWQPLPKPYKESDTNGKN